MTYDEPILDILTDYRDSEPELDAPSIYTRGARLIDLGEHILNKELRRLAHRAEVPVGPCRVICSNFPYTIPALVYGNLGLIDVCPEYHRLYPSELHLTLLRALGRLQFHGEDAFAIYHQHLLERQDALGELTIPPTLEEFAAPRSVHGWEYVHECARCNDSHYNKELLLTPCQSCGAWFKTGRSYERIPESVLDQFQLVHDMAYKTVPKVDKSG